MEKQKEAELAAQASKRSVPRVPLNTFNPWQPPLHSGSGNSSTSHGSNAMYSMSTPANPTQLGAPVSHLGQSSNTSMHSYAHSIMDGTTSMHTFVNSLLAGNTGNHAYLNSLVEDDEANEDEFAGDSRHGVNVFVLVTTINERMSGPHSVFHSAGLVPQQLIKLYPLELQKELWNYIPISKLPVRPVSVASLVHNLTQISKKTPESSAKFRLQLCALVQHVYGQLGGTREVVITDFSGCRRFHHTDKSHLCPGSHCDRTCPQALTSLSPVGNPAFQAIYDMMQPERLAGQCRIRQTDDHNSSTCAAQHQYYGKCGNCRTYTLNSVYPEIYMVLITLLRDSSVGEDDRHAYRVQLATGLLSAAWGQFPQSTLAPLAQAAFDRN
jgi:hypothetical protein